MKNEILIKFLSFLENIGISSILGGLIGAIIQRMRKGMTMKKFFSVAIMGMFVGWIIGSVLMEWTNLSDKVIYSACALSGVFAEDLLKEMEDLIKNLSEFVKKWIDKKIE